MTPHPEKRLITIDAETVERIRKDADALRAILAAWEEGAERRDAQREHYPTDKCSDPDCAYAQEVASLHVQVSRLESRLDSTRGELERTRERLREAEQEIAHKLADPAPQEAEDRAFQVTEPDECDYCRAFRFRDWDTVGRLQEERGGPDKACRCDSWERNHD